MALDRITSPLSSFSQVLTTQWHIFTTAYPGLLERSIFAIGIVYLASIGWLVFIALIKASSGPVRWCVHRVSRVPGLTPVSTFEERDSNEGIIDNELYGLEHMALNWTWESGLNTMWMNMGYWKDTTSFPQASENLLHYLLQKSGIISTLGKATKGRSISILDLGFGCGDQTLYLTKQLPSDVNVTSYVGITLSKLQYVFARKRVLEGQHVVDILLDQPKDTGRDHDSDSGLNIANTKPMPFTFLDNGPKMRSKANVSLYNADASNPSTWPSSLHLSLLPPISPPTSPCSQPPSQSSSPAMQENPMRENFSLVHSGSFINAEADGATEHWTIGLDSLYHFRPSREPILKYAHDKLHSNLLAFDLFRPNQASITQSVFLRAFCLMASIPYHNLVTQEEYFCMLVEKIGYQKENVMIEDISEFVFPGLSDFVSRRTKEMEKMGVKWKRWAGFKVVAWVIQTGLLRGGVVVARWKGDNLAISDPDRE